MKRVLEWIGRHSLLSAVIAIALFAIAAAEGLTIDKGPIGTNGATRALTTQDRQRTTYSYTTGAFGPGATPTDVVALAGPTNGRIARVTRIYLATTQTTAGINNWFIVKRSAVNTGGVGIVQAGVARDSLSPAASALPTIYTSAPTVGASIGNVWTGAVNSPAPATAGIGGYVGVVIDFTAPGTEPLILRKSTELVGVNFAGAALPAGMAPNIVIEWTEEPILP